MGRFAFVTDDESEDYCLDIAKAMSDIYCVSEDEAIELINLQWQGTTVVGDLTWLYHDFAAIWAQRIYRRHRLG